MCGHERQSGSIQDLVPSLCIEESVSPEENQKHLAWGLELPKKTEVAQVSRVESGVQHCTALGSASGIAQEHGHTHPPPPPPRA